MRQARLALGLTQEQLAAMLRCRQSHISLMESCARRPVPKTRERLAVLLRQPRAVVDSWFDAEQESAA